MASIHVSNTDDQDLEKAEAITAELVSNLLRKQKGWENIYLKLREVKEHSLFLCLGIPSFTRYVIYLASQANCQSSYIWRAWDAGRYYARLTRSEAGAAFKNDLETKGQIVGDEVITDIRRIAGQDTDLAVTILKKFSSGELTKSDIKSLKKAKKYRSDKDDDVLSEQIALQEEVPEVRESDILIALSPDTFHLYEKWQELSGKDKFHLPKGDRGVFEIFPEFTIRVPGIRDPRSIDVLIVTNFDAGRFGADQHEVTLRAVAIKTSPADLQSDQLLKDYELFANACYLAVPATMETLGLQYLPEGWGFLVFDPAEQSIVCAKEPIFQKKPSLGTRALQTLIVKKLQARDFYSK